MWLGGYGVRSLIGSRSLYLNLKIVAIFATAPIFLLVLDARGAATLLGAQVLLVGIRPEVAQTIVALGIDFRALFTYASLQEAVGTLLAEQGRLVLR
jgi:anti-anti-sigma regulatory factor